MLPDQPTPGKAITLREGQDRKLKTPAPPPDHHVKCPRCDSPNTKFCYYNNYSLSQPRHFCKSCRRYWTEGGTLRNVPVGGGCRKNKKMKQRFLPGMSNSRDSDSGEGHNFFQGFVTPAMDFQLGSINPPSSSSMFPDIDTNFSLYDPRYNTSQFNPSHHQNSGEVGALTGYDYLRPAQSRGGGDKNSMVVHSNLASSIESLSSINQELHWKLQQQRLRALFSGNQSENLSTRPDLSQFDHHQQQPETRAQKLQLQPILFQSLEPTMEGAEVPGQSGRRQGEDGGGSNSATEWFFDVSPYTNDVSNNKGGFTNELDDSRMNQEVNDDNQTDNWNSGIQTWRYLQQYNGAFP